MSYDLNILVLEQDKPVSLPFSSNIGVLNESQEELRYHSIWSFMSQSRGSWYCLGHSDGHLFNALAILEAGFDIEPSTYLKPYWIIDEQVKSEMVPLNIATNFLVDFKKIMSFLINQSPINTVMFLARFQGHDKEVLCGVISLQEFWNLMEEGGILFNVCYVISC